MRQTLITFLGRTPKTENGYRTTCYDFGDGNTCQPVAFFGWALNERLNPDRLVILGTSGSMWDHLFEGDHNLGEEEIAKRLNLMELVEKKAVDQETLNALQPLLSKRLGREVRLRLIPDCSTKTEQVQLLEILADEVDQSDKVDLDITHGFRHLPMLALLAALHLEKVKSVEISDIWYGSYDPDTGKAAVMHLRGLLHIAEWLEALAEYENTAEYDQFAPLVGGPGKGQLPGKHKPHWSGTHPLATDTERVGHI